MAERIKWGDDKGLYQPRIRAVLIRRLHMVKEITGRPMTVLVDEALSLYLTAFMNSTGHEHFPEQIETFSPNHREPIRDDVQPLPDFNDPP